MVEPLQLAPQPTHDLRRIVALPGLGHADAVRNFGRIGSTPNRRGIVVMLNLDRIVTMRNPGRIALTWDLCPTAWICHLRRTASVCPIAYTASV